MIIFCSHIIFYGYTKIPLHDYTIVRLSYCPNTILLPYVFDTMSTITLLLKFYYAILVNLQYHSTIQLLHVQHYSTTFCFMISVELFYYDTPLCLNPKP